MIRLLNALAEALSYSVRDNYFLIINVLRRPYVCAMLLMLWMVIYVSLILMLLAYLCYWHFHTFKQMRESLRYEYNV